ncbi:MAG: hypothetical protein A4E57_03295 [Syntrophorhabdaceae bacterium PtaU1.Bin034]|nr:MAG: hypothetical protein A4E57_03295 [Syntrophorhabdaceae bacterium PtaU1.Bin034]
MLAHAFEPASAIEGADYTTGRNVGCSLSKEFLVVVLETDKDYIPGLGKNYRGIIADQDGFSTNGCFVLDINAPDTFLGIPKTFVPLIGGSGKNANSNIRPPASEESSKYVCAATSSKNGTNRMIALVVRKGLPSKISAH